MKIKSIATIVAIAFLPIAGFAQTPPAPPGPPPPAPQAPPGQPGHKHEHEKAPKVPMTFLGVETSQVPSVVSEQLGLPKGFGLVVDYVVPDSPSAAAGVQQNDIIKMLNDQILTEPDQLSKLVRSYSEGTTVTLTVLRKGKEEKVGVKLSKKEVPQEREFGPGRHRHNFNFNGMDMGDFGMGELNERMQDLKQQLGDEKRGMIHDAVIKAQIVFSDDKGELRVEKIDNKKVLTAKDPQGRLLFSGPVETKEDLDKVPAEVRQRYEKLQQHDLPAVAPDDLRAESESDADEDDDVDEDSSRASTVSYDQVCSQQAGHRAWEIHTVLI